MPGATWFEWDEDNVDHIARHDVEPDEAEDALRDPHRHLLRKGDDRLAIGRTPVGRILFVVFTLRGRAIRIVTAYDATEREKQQYRRQRRRR